MQPGIWIFFVIFTALVAASGYLRRTLALLWIIAGSFVFLCVVRDVATWNAPTEYLELTYDEYKAAMRDAYFDPVGASDISQCTSTTRDGYDCWWRFVVSESDFVAIVTEAANEENGPAEVEFSNVADPPVEWREESDIPDWWMVEPGKEPQAIHWCYLVGDAERHHGWYFVHNSETNEAWCWHWNHQWSSNQCVE